MIFKTMEPEGRPGAKHITMKYLIFVIVRKNKGVSNEHLFSSYTSNISLPGNNGFTYVNELGPRLY